MNLLLDTIPRDILLTCGLIFIIVAARAVRAAPWHSLRSPPDRLHLLLGAAVMLALLWSMTAGVTPGLGIHYLAVTTLTLMFGWAFALLLVVFALAATTAVSDLPWSLLPVNALISGVVPVAVSHYLYAWVTRALPRHPFIFLFLCAFIGSMLAMFATVVATALFMGVMGGYTLDRIAHEYIVYLPLLLMSEGLLNGFMVTAMVIFRPESLWTFDAERYFRGR